MTLRSWTLRPLDGQRTLQTIKTTNNVFSRGLTVESEVPDPFEMSSRFGRSGEIRG
jgi:hypothetical protein